MCFYRNKKQFKLRSKLYKNTPVKFYSFSVFVAINSLKKNKQLQQVRKYLPKKGKKRVIELVSSHALCLPEVIKATNVENVIFVIMYRSAILSTIFIIYQVSILNYARGTCNTITKWLFANLNSTFAIFLSRYHN